LVAGATGGRRMVAGRAARRRRRAGGGRRGPRIRMVAAWRAMLRGAGGAWVQTERVFGSIRHVNREFGV
jgi:hypothetical protein